MINKLLTEINNKIKQINYELEHWDWDKKEKELKIHLHKYKNYYILATLLILLITLIPFYLGENTYKVLPNTILFGGGEENTSNTSAKPSESEPVKPTNIPAKSSNTPKEGNANPKNTPKEGNEKAKEGNEKGEEEGKKKKKEKKRKGKGAGGNKLGMIKGAFGKMGGGIMTGFKNVAKLFLFVFAMILVILAPAVLYMALIYFIFKFLTKRTVKI